LNTTVVDIIEKETGRGMHTMDQRTWGSRLRAVAGALALNLVLFAVMPYLQHPDRDRPEFDQLISQVNVVRVKRPERPVKKKSETPPEPPQRLERPKPQAMAPQQARLTLPFAVNPRLPAGPGSLVLPDFNLTLVDITGLGGDFTASDLDAPLTVLARMPPVYPLGAKHRGIEGWVRVRFVVEENGRVGNVTVLEGKPPGIFDQSVIRCVSGWRFKPGTIEGMPVRAWAETTIRFKLE
jgi:protein TonB